MSFKFHTRLKAWLCVGFLVGTATVITQAGGFALVTNGNDSGAGSLRDALEVQQANFVVISHRVAAINIDSTLEYSGESALTIIGTGQTVATQRNLTLLAVTEGADLSVSRLDFAGPGGFSILNRGDQGELPAGKGIFVDVRDDQTGTVSVLLQHVGVSGVANHGIHISDCSLADDCGSGEGAPASISLTCNFCTVDDAGNGKFDADGIRIDDRGDGSIQAIFRRSSFTRVGADGVKLHEGNDGDTFVTALWSDFSNNGGYCDPTILAPFFPDPGEGEFDEAAAVTEADIPDPITGSPDDSCIEREVATYDSGFVEAYEFGIDLDDGVEMDGVEQI